MGINCHISIKRYDGGDNLTLLNAADVRWISRDKELRETLGIPDLVAGDFWEHENNDDYQRVLDAALVHKEMLTKQRDLLGVDNVIVESRHYESYMDAKHAADDISREIERVDEWLAYYELAATLVKLGHTVTCYGV